MVISILRHFVWLVENLDMEMDNPVQHIMRDYEEYMNTFGVLMCSNVITKEEWHIAINALDALLSMYVCKSL